VSWPFWWLAAQYHCLKVLLYSCTRSWPLRSFFRNSSVTSHVHVGAVHTSQATSHNITFPYQPVLHALKIKRQGLCSTPIDGALLTRYYRRGYSIAARTLTSLEQQHPTQEDQTRPH
jgi:hypothetical protein